MAGEDLVELIHTAGEIGKKGQIESLDTEFNYLNTELPVKEVCIYNEYVESRY